MAAATPTTVRKYNLHVIPKTGEPDLDFLRAVQNAGVTDLWISCFVGGYWWCGLDAMQSWRKRIMAMGMNAHVIQEPTGGPDFAAPKHWPTATSADGRSYTGTSLHPPIVKENCDVLQKIPATGVKRVFLDDGFRLASMPGCIGGCFCPEHKRAFLQRTGYGDAQWRNLIDAIAHGKLTPELRAWVNFTCDQLTDCFHALQKAAPTVELGIMVMYLGAEKAGIRLTDYRGLPIRVGEYRFWDEAFAPPKGKTDELFSSLFHRRFVRPELAYSETTAFPEKKLSLKNKVAKLAVSTLSDVRNTMCMCDFPKPDWPTLGPAMKRHAEIHAKIAGHAPQGPLKHFWGEASRFTGDDDPYSLFLALGIPFEVTDSPAADGFTFLSDADASVAPRSPGTALIARPRPAPVPGVRFLPESLKDLYAFKREIAPQLANVPYVEDEKPVVCAWYPTAKSVLLWNLAEQRVELTLRCRQLRRTISVDALDVALIEGVNMPTNTRST
jgi:hypothetical protein